MLHDSVLYKFTIDIDTGADNNDFRSNYEASTYDKIRDVVSHR